MLVNSQLKNCACIFAKDIRKLEIPTGEAECGGMTRYSQSNWGCLTWHSSPYLLIAGCHTDKETCSKVKSRATHKDSVCVYVFEGTFAPLFPFYMPTTHNLRYST